MCWFTCPICLDNLVIMLFLVFARAPDHEKQPKTILPNFAGGWQNEVQNNSAPYTRFSGRWQARNRSEVLWIRVFVASDY
jgi:hypothetical protein